MQDGRTKQENKRGRPRDESRDKVIIEAVLLLLAKTGYDGLSIEAVAQQAKVGKTTIYRRWSSKVELVIEAASSISPFKNIPERIDSNQTLRNQLIELLCLNFENEIHSHQKAISAIGAAMPHHKELEKGLHEDFYRNHRSLIESIVTPFLKKEHTLKEEDLDLLADLGPALLTYRIFLIQDSFNRVYVDRIVDKLMLPMIESELK